MLGVSVQASAQIYESTYIDTNGIEVHAPATRLMLNPASPVTLTLISGLDRYVNVKVISASGTQLLNTTTTRTGVADRLKAGDGSEFYGKKVTLPALGEGKSTVQVNILDLNQSVVASYSYNWLIDTTPPTGNALTANASNGSTAGSVWKLGLEATGQYDFTSTNVTDANGIEKGLIYIYRSNGSLFSTTQMQYDITGKKMYHTYTKNSVKSVGIPDSNLDEDFTAKVVIYDNAGNTRTLPTQLFRYDNTLGEMTLWAVHDPGTTTSVVPGISSYPAYKAGMTVNENPIRLVYRLPKSNYRAYAEGGLQFINLYASPKEIAVDNTYTYVEMTLPYGANNGDMARMANFGQWGGYYPSYSLVLNPVANKTPMFTGTYVDFLNDKGVWTTWKDFESVSSSRLPITITRLRFNVESRPFDQEIGGKATYTIPAGQTSCEAPESFVMAPGILGYNRILYYVRSVSNPILRTKQWIMTRWNNKQLPVISSISYDETNKQLTVLASLEGDGNWFDSVSLREFYLTDKNTGKRMTPVGSIKSRTSGNYTLVYDLSSQAEGKYNVVVNVIDFFRNQTDKTYGEIALDNTVPTVAISFDGKPITDSTVVYGLENIRIALADNLTTPRITRLQLTGGPTADSVELTWSPAGTNTYAPEYPRLFPNFEPSENYALSVTVSDSQSNTKTYTQKFSYLPNNLVQLHNLRTLSVSSALKTSSNEPLAYLSTNVLRKTNGEIAKGIQNATLTVRKDAAFGIKFNGVQAAPGESADVSIDMGQGENLLMPIYPAESGKVGTSEFMIQIDELK
ncbi:Ig-like domain-containing protein [Photorhabdus tasmaniensis]